jgi:hypothetical protein
MNEHAGMARLRRFSEQVNRGWNSPEKASLLIAFGYCIVVGIALSQHEMWRDEIEAWLIARDSASLPQLFQNLKNEGHPGLWYLLLMPLTRLSWSPELMQILHLGIATLTVYLVSRYSPFSRLQTLLFPVGFFTAWQYAVVSRDYALGLLLLIMFCLLYERRYERFPLVGLILMLAAQTHALVLILVMAISIALAVDVSLQFAQRRRDLDSRLVRKIILGFCFIAGGVILSFAQLIPDEEYVGPTDAVARFFRANILAIGLFTFLGGALFTLLFYILRARLSLALLSGFAAIGIVLYFDASVLGAIPGTPGSKFFAFIGLAVYLFMLYQLRDCLSLLLLYGLGTAGLLVFFSAVHSGGPHQHGLLFIIYVVAYWLERATRSKSPGAGEEWRNRTADVLFTLILMTQSIFGVKALYQDLTTPYSNGKYVAQYIRSQGWQELPIVGCMDFSAQTVVGYLGIDKIYYPQGERWGSYMVWDQKRYENMGLEKCLESALSLKRDLGTDVLVVSSYTKDSSPRESQFRRIAEFTGALRDDENFTLYQSRSMAQESER